MSTNKELNQHFGVKRLRDRVRKLPSALHSEITIPRPTFASTITTKGRRVPMDMNHAVFFDCMICGAGFFCCDRRLKGKDQTKQCSSCQNPVTFLQTQMGKWKYDFNDKVIAHQSKSDW